MGILLSLIAPFLYAILSPLNLVVILIKNIKKHGFWSIVDKYSLTSAINVDKFGNKSLAPLLNATLIKNSKCLFGEDDETISSVLGKNQRDRTLTIGGWIVAITLIILDFSTWKKQGHCINSIKR